MSGRRSGKSVPVLRAQMGELRSLGFKSGQIAKILNIHRTRVSQLLPLRTKFTARGWDQWTNKRGFEIPTSRRTEYKAFRALGLTTEECGWEMKLLDRPVMANAPRRASRKPGDPIGNP